MIFLFKNIIASLCLLLLILVLFEMTGADMLVQQQLYNDATQQWLWAKQEPVAKLILYDGANYALYGLAAIILFALVFLRKRRLVREYRAGLVVVLLSLILVPGTVALLKSATNVPCPRNLERFGAEAPYVKLFDHFPDTFDRNRRYRCFPAAHASGGFALLAFFFLFKTASGRRWALCLGGAAGGVMGGYKMAIGDHFLSHTLVSLVWAWLLISVIALAVSALTRETLPRSDPIPEAGS